MKCVRKQLEAFCFKRAKVTNLNFIKCMQWGSWVLWASMKTKRKGLEVGCAEKLREEILQACFSHLEKAPREQNQIFRASAISFFQLSERESELLRAKKKNFSPPSYCILDLEHSFRLNKLSKYHKTHLFTPPIFQSHCEQSEVETTEL